MDTTMRTARIELPGNRVLHLALTFDHDGAPADLCIAAGYASDAPLRLLGSGVNVPAGALPALRDALTDLTP